jgi:hypothetical protein
MSNVFSHSGNANQNNRFYLTLLEWLSSRKNAGEDAEERGTLIHSWWECKLM